MRDDLAVGGVVERLPVDLQDLVRHLKLGLIRRRTLKVFMNEWMNEWFNGYIQSISGFLFLFQSNLKSIYERIDDGWMNGLIQFITRILAAASAGKPGMNEWILNTEPRLRLIPKKWRVDLAGSGPGSLGIGFLVGIGYTIPPPLNPLPPPLPKKDPVLPHSMVLSSVLQGLESVFVPWALPSYIVGEGEQDPFQWPEVRPLDIDPG